MIPTPNFYTSNSLFVDYKSSPFQMGSVFGTLSRIDWAPCNGWIDFSASVIG